MNALLAVVDEAGFPKPKAAKGGCTPLVAAAAVGVLALLEEAAAPKGEGEAPFVAEEGDAKLNLKGAGLLSDSFGFGAETPLRAAPLAATLLALPNILDAPPGNAPEVPLPKVEVPNPLKVDGT